MYNRLVAAPGENILLGATQGGVLLLQPPGLAPGAMNLLMMQSKLLFLLREDGPDTGYPLPTTGDFTAAVMARDLTIALAQFISETGVAPDLSDRMDTFPVYPVLDYPVPPSLVALHKIDYTPAGQPLYPLNGLSLSEFDRDVGGLLPPVFGQPLCYREPYAGYVRLYPQPGPGNAVGPGAGTIVLGGAPSVGDKTHVVVSNGALVVTTPNYTTTASDTPSTIVVQLQALLNVSPAVQGVSAFLAPPSPISNQLVLTSLLAPGTQITYQVVTTSTTMTASPTSPTNLAPNGDTITFYYTSAGNVLTNPGDTPGIPWMFHMNLVYRVLGDYWLRKQDSRQADAYMKRYEIGVAKGKAYTYDSKRSTQPTMSGEDTYGYSDYPFGGM